ncbi:hypothetical protein K438DRAFT_1803940 [Mycena galopus ATCC 62051]|nr:hypothetical protein K438DRAFT_1803940 [Mycena galopus ATCC 62051]
MGRHCTPKSRMRLLRNFSIPFPLVSATYRLRSTSRRAIASTSSSSAHALAWIPFFGIISVRILSSGCDFAGIKMSTRDRVNARSTRYWRVNRSAAAQRDYEVCWLNR